MFYYVAIVLLALLDIVATHYQIVVAGTISIEANPIMRHIMSTYGMGAAYAFRLVLPVTAIPLFLWAQKRIDRKSWLTTMWPLRALFIAHFLLFLYHVWQTNFFTIHLG